MIERAVSTSRAKARADTTEQIKQIARSHLAQDGPNLSLRAVARDLGVVSSAVYRYFASRDDLLTALILDGFASLGAAVEDAESVVARRDLLGRWMAVGRSTRQWSVARPHEFALLFGTPVPGYQAPQATIEQAARTVRVAMRILADGVARGVVELPADRLARAVRTDIEGLAALAEFAGVPPTLLARATGVWAQLYGVVGFELFGRFGPAITDWDAYFDHQLRSMARTLGLSR